MSSQAPYQIWVSSVNRVNPTSTNKYNFTYQIDGVVLDVREVELLAATIPNTGYTFTSNNNTIVTSLGTITITPGYYSESDFLTELDTQFSTLVGFAPVTVTASSTTGKLTINGAVPIQITGVGTTAWYELGMDYQTNWPSVAAASFTMPNIFDISGTRRAVIKVSNIPMLVSNGTFGASFGVPFIVPSGEIQFYQQMSGHKQIIPLGQRVDLNSFQVTLYDDAGRLMDLNGPAWSFLLEFR